MTPGTTWRPGIAGLPPWPGILHALRDAIPAACPLCGGRARGGALCPGCRDDLGMDGQAGRCLRCALRLAGTGCPDCAGWEPAFERTVVAFDYAPPADALVLQLKQSLRWGRAAMLGALVAQAVRSHGWQLRPGTVILPIPSSAAALRRRGFNPAAEVARAAGSRLGVPVRSDILFVQERQAVRQSTLSRAQRLDRAPDRFGVRLERLSSAPHDDSGLIRVALLDDVMTTGSTLHAAAQALRANGVDSVVALAVARTPHPGARAPGRVS
jgi:predicted amidophosphoribosyltransferase